MNRVPRVLLIDDDEHFRLVTRTELSDQNLEVVAVGNTAQAQEHLREKFYHVVLLDLMLADEHGKDFVPVIQEISPDSEIIVLTGNATVQSAVGLLKAGVYDYKTKPCPIDELEPAIRNAVERVHLQRDNQALRKVLSGSGKAPRLIGNSPEMKRVRAQVEEVAEQAVPVLLLGESGTGKEVVSRLIHETSHRSEYPFVPVDAGTIPRDLFEAELFGYQKGAFTGADEDTEGLVASAAGGTLFLDEIGEVPLDMQSKLLRFLETQEYRRVGDTQLRQADVRIVSATNRSLDTMVEEGTFREDLYFRLNVFPIEIPPLRDHLDDLDELVPHLIKQSEVKQSNQIEVEPDAINALKNYHWPGNVRELKNVLDRLLISVDDTLTGEDVNRTLDTGPDVPSTEIKPLEQVESREIKHALKYYEGDKPAVAKALDISLKTLYNKIKKYNIEKG